MHPHDNTLRVSNDFRLLSSNKGSLSEEQWNDKKHTYLRTDRVLLIPAKVEYLQQNITRTNLTLNIRQI
jgi:hypothetical protein